MDDDIVIKIMEGVIKEKEKQKCNYIIEGFPRTQRQALALLKMGVIPDKLIMLDKRDGEIIEYLQNKIKRQGNKANLLDMVHSALTEYKLNIEGVKHIYKGSITNVDANNSLQDVSEEIMHRVLKLKHSKGPSRPQRIILMGTPGCGKEKYAQRVADEYQLVYIQVTQLLKDAVRREGTSSFAQDLA